MGSRIVTSHDVNLRVSFHVDFEKMAELFHEHYEELAPKLGYQTRKESAVAWQDVPEQNKRLMIETCAHMADHLFDFVVLSPSTGGLFAWNESNPK